MNRPWRRLRTPPQARVIQVVEVAISEGDGTDEAPVRAERYSHSLDGALLSRGDQHECEQG